MTEDLDGLNLSELIDAIAQEDVLIVRFQNFEERLLLDMRLGEDEQPLVRMVGPVSSAEERTQNFARFDRKWLCRSALWLFHGLVRSARWSG